MDILGLLTDKQKDRLYSRIDLDYTRGLYEADNNSRLILISTIDTKDADEYIFDYSKEIKLCYNDEDPISGTEFASLSDEEKKNIIRLENNHCYEVESIFGWYKVKAEGNLDVTDPLDPSYILTEKDIAQINEVMKRLDTSYSAPKEAVAVDLSPPDLNLEFLAHRDYRNLAVVAITNPDPNIAIAMGLRPGVNYIVKILGNVPSTLDGTDTGEFDAASSLLFAYLSALWQAGELQPNNDPMILTGFTEMDNSTVRGGSMGWWPRYARDYGYPNALIDIDRFKRLMLDVKNRYDLLPQQYKVF